MHALETLLAHVVDYAGLFPPAALGMADAAREYAAQRASGERWMLGRFVVPAARLDELAPLLPNDPAAPWPLSVLWRADADAARAAPAGACVASAEMPVADADALPRARDLALRAGLPAAQLYAELPGDADPAPFADAARACGVSLKLRTGGVTPDAFPTADAVVRFMAACAARGVRYKLTAGLHHPLRGEHALTYEPGCARGTMHGFLNVLAAASLLAAGHDAARVAPLLEERDARALSFADDGVRWRGLAAAPADLRMERRLLVSFGSCSFAEPVADLRALGLLPTA
jgi:hypothetical protein